MSNPRITGRLRGLLLAAAAAVALSACGGGSDPPAPEPQPLTQIPDSALASAEAYTDFALGLAPSDTTEPLSAANVDTAPVSDTTEPIDVE
jgi:hypothetical protein